MAIGHISVRVHSRSQGHSAAAALAYRAGLTLEDSRTGETHNYSRRSDRENIAAAGLTDGPFRTFGELATAIESAEKRKDASILRDVQPAIPAELDEADGIALVERFAKELGERYHTATAWAVHRPDRRSDQRNTHGHVVLPTRALEDDGQFSRKKIRALDDRRTGPAEIHAIRALWEKCANEALIAAESTARVDTGRTANPVPTLGPERTGVERRAYRKRNGHEPAGLSVPELVEDGAVTGAGRRVARHRSRRQEPAHEAKRVAPAEARIDAEISAKTHGGVAGGDAGPGSSAPLPSPSLSPAEEIEAIDQEIEALKRAAFETWLADEPPAPENVPQETLQSAPSAPTPGTAPNPPADRHGAQDGPAPAPDAMAPTPAPDAPRATKPRRERGEGWSVRAISDAAAQRTVSAPEPVHKPEATGFDFDAWLHQEQPSPPDQDREREPLTPDTAPAQSPREAEETETMPTDATDQIARQRWRAGPAVSVHADTHGIETTSDEQERAVQYLKGAYDPDGTERPALGAAVDQCARAALVGKPLAADPLAEACASTAAAAEARRMTEQSVEDFKRDHPPQRGIISALEEWRRTLRPGLMKKILTVIVPLEVQHNRRRRPDQAQRPPGPDFGI